MATDYFALAVDLARREFHPCGGCRRPAKVLDRSLTSGAAVFVCYVCDPKGHPTLVFPRFAPMDATRAGEA